MYTILIKVLEKVINSFTLQTIFKKKILKRFTWLGKIEEFYLSLDFS